MRRLDRTTVDLIARKLPATLLTVLQTFPGEVVLAGGAVRDALLGKKPRDYDLFFSNKGDEKLHKHRDNAIEGLRRINSQMKVKGMVTNTSPVSCTLEVKDGPDWQMCYGFEFSTPLQLIEGFDFTVCQIAFYFFGDSYGWEAITTQEFWRDLNAGALVYNPNFSGKRITSIDRLHKYLKYGYKMSSDDLLAYLNDYKAPKNKGKKDTGGFS